MILHSLNITYFTEKMSRGKLIVFEGLDRAGKTTQCQMLVEALQKDGQNVKFMRFPGTQLSGMKG